MRTFTTTLNGIPIHKLVATAADGPAAIRGTHSGFIALCCKDPEFPDFHSCHCGIHQQALAGKNAGLFCHVMMLVVKIVN